MESGATLLDHLRDAHTRRASGVLDYEVAGRARRILMHGGGMLLPADSLLAAEVRRLSAAGDAAHWEPLLDRLAARLVEEAGARSLCLRPIDRAPRDAAGPVPTWALIRRAFALAADPSRDPDPSEALIADVPHLPPASGPPCWTPEELWVLERLRTAAPYALLERDCPFRTLQLRRVVAGLRAVGVVRAPDRASSFAHDSGLLKLVELLRARIGASLRERPLGLLDDALQRRLEALARGASAMNHYELLGVEPDADESEVQAAFDGLARLVHPSHAERAGVLLSPGELNGLFERAVAAMRTLGDPALRSAYDDGHGFSRAPDQDSSDRRLEVAELARREFERARYEERNGDLHSALVLYEQAAAMAPSAEHWLGLARLQAKNPAWGGRALESFRRALELDPQRGGEIRFAMAEALERSGKLDEAVSYYQSALQGPAPPTGAREALERLAGQGHGKEAHAAGGRLGRLFRRR